jgi:hypothetical protein
MAEVFGSDSHCEQLTMGAVTENLTQLADYWGLQGRWDFCRNGARYVEFVPSQPESYRKLDKRHPVFTRHTNRFRFASDALAREDVEELSSLAQEDCRIAVYTSRHDLEAISALIRTASSMRFRNRLLHEWFGKTLRFTEEESRRGDGLDVRTIELPPGGSALLRLIMDWGRMALLNRVGMYQLLSAIESQAVARSPAILAVIGPPSQPFAAGRLMERAWLALERMGLAAQPYYVLSDQLVRLANGQLPEAVKDECRRLAESVGTFLGPGLFPHMLLRAGRARAQVLRSKRLPLHAVIAGAEGQAG